MTVRFIKIRKTIWTNKITYFLKSKPEILHHISFMTILKSPTQYHIHQTFSHLVILLKRCNSNNNSPMSFQTHNIHIYSLNNLTTNSTVNFQPLFMMIWLIGFVVFHMCGDFGLKNFPSKFSFVVFMSLFCCCIFHP